MSYSSKLNPNVVKTALDDVFKQEFDGKMHPGWVDAQSPLIFKQDSTDKAAEIQEVFKGTGLWSERAEEQDVAQADPRIANQITFNVANYAQSIDIPKNFFDDNMHGAYEKMVTDMAETARITRDSNAMGLYRNAFSTTLTADGVTLISDSHVNLNGDTIDNKLTAVLAEASLNTAILALAEMKAQDGTIRGNVPATLLVPMALFKTASTILDSELQSGTDFNNINVYSSRYGINLATSPYLGAAAGGSDTAWFLLGSNHSVTRWVRQDVSTDLIDWRLQRNNNYIYKGEFREMTGALDYNAIVGSDGSV